MAKIPEEQLNRLRAAGLFVSEARSSTHVWPDCVFVGKPAAVKGNSIDGYETGYGMDSALKFDAPLVNLYGDAGSWYVVSVDYTPGPGPGDFSNTWKSAAEAVDDILDFFLGNPSRMREKEQARRSLR
ncbi:MAG: hypothetical protein AB7W16_16305 [Candidatus Obscuribacterales bacterium]